MGLLRLYLAICVVMAHSDPIFPWAMLDGRQAVQLFFVISGFYMQFVLSTKYSSRRTFYVSRSLRIFVPYFSVLGFVVLVSAVFGATTGDWLALRAYAQNEAQNGALGISLTALSNLTVFFQDWVMFFKHDAGESLRFTTNFWNSPSPLWNYLLIPQCWSIGVELTFYLIAPFAAQRLGTQWLLGAIVLSLAARISFLCLDRSSQRPLDLPLLPI